MTHESHTRTRASQQAFTLVEVLVAMVLLTVVITGVAVAVTSGVKATTKSEATSSLSIVAQRAFERLRNDRGWMTACGAGCNVAPAIPAAILADPSLGTCGTTPYQHQAVAGAAGTAGTGPTGSWASRITSNAATADQDPDYYSIRIEIRANPCAADRLGNPKSGVFIGTVDKEGNVARGNLDVMVCNAPIQADDRVSLSGCANGASGVAMLDCPNTSDEYEDACKDAILNQGTGNADADWTKQEKLTRGTASFRIVDAAGNLVTTSASATTPETGLYRFNNLPATSLYLRNITGTGDLWETKLIPSLEKVGTERRLGVIVQPNSRSQALLMFRAPKTNKQFRVTFKRDVDRWKMTDKAWMNWSNTFPTKSWGGPAGGYLTWIHNQMDSVQSWVSSCSGAHAVGCSITGGPSESHSGVCYSYYIQGRKDYEAYDVTHSHGRPRITETHHYPARTSYNTFNLTTCAYVRVDYHIQWNRGIRDDIVSRNGTLVPARYWVTPEPSYRSTVASNVPDDLDHGTSPTTVTCPETHEVHDLGPRWIQLNGGCTSLRGNDNKLTRVLFGGFTPGLNSGVRVTYHPPTGSCRMNPECDAYGLWTADRNWAHDTEAPGGPSTSKLPNGMYQKPASAANQSAAIWVKPNGNWTTGAPSSNTYTDMMRDFTVNGRGECIWKGTNNPADNMPVLSKCGACNVLYNNHNFWRCSIAWQGTWTRSVGCTNGPSTYCGLRYDTTKSIPLSICNDLPPYPATATNYFRGCFEPGPDGDSDAGGTKWGDEGEFDPSIGGSSSPSDPVAVGGS